MSVPQTADRIQPSQRAGEPRVLVVFGTRPEAIKLAPVIAALRPKAQVHVCVTGQHREMLDQVLRLFDIRPDDDLALMRDRQDLFDITSAALLGLRDVMQRVLPDLVMVQGDTSTTFAAALSAFYLGIDVAHVEAGLRTADKRRPFPEEANRRLTSAVSTWHFAPTMSARANLLAEDVPADRIFVTGNTAIDALLQVTQHIERRTLQPEILPAVEEACAGRRLILVTSHRRENFGEGFVRICTALRRILESHPDVAIVYPLHLNPNVHDPVTRLIGGVPRLVLTPPVDYVTFVALMQRATIVLTDSGGVQEEAPSLRKPVLVMREKTERLEGVEAGVAQLVGTSTERIVEAVGRLLSDTELYARMASQQNPYGDGQASGRIADVIHRVLASRLSEPSA